MKHFSDYTFDFSDEPSDSVLLTTHHDTGNISIFSSAGAEGGAAVTIRLNVRQLATLISDLSTLLARNPS